MDPDDPLHRFADDVEPPDEGDLVSRGLTTLSLPPSAPADSFVLHAPLELMARAALLRSVDPGQREVARRRIADISTEWSSRTPHAMMPLQRPTASLPDAIAAGDVDGADRALVDLAAQQTTDEFVVAASEALLAYLGGAGPLHLPRPAHPPASRLPVDEARRQLLRVAAMSMLQDDPAYAPYGWIHCLTMPQATLRVAPRISDPRRAIAIAATYVLGFRVTQSNTAIDLDWEPPARRNRTRLLETDADAAVAMAWHAEHPGRIERDLATFAASHRDAHLAKYVVACQHAANDDPGAAHLYRAAATRLALWWRDHDSRHHGA